MLRFEQSIQSKYTLRNYKSQIERFLKFTKLKGELYTAGIVAEYTEKAVAEQQKNPVLRAIEQGEVKFYFKDVPRDNTENVQGAINEVKKLLQSQSNSKIKFTIVNEQKNYNVLISWIKDFGEHRIGTALPQNLNIGYGFTNCVREWTEFDQETITRIIMHEIGHSLGFDYSTDKNNIMYEKGTGVRYDYWWYDPEGMTSTQVESDTGGNDILHLCAGEYLIEIETDKPVSIDLFSHTAVGTYEFDGNIYPEFTLCESEWGVTSYKKTCSIERSATLNMLIGIYGDGETEYTDYNVKIERLDKLPEMNMNWDENSYRYPDIYSDFFG